MAVAAHVRLEDELRAKDSERARRYAATVRPAIAALRFVRPDRRQSDHSTAAGRVATRGGGDTPKVIDVASNEEDYTGRASDEGPLEEDHEERDVRVVAAEKGETTPDGETLNEEGGAKSIDEVPSEEGDLAAADEAQTEEGDARLLDETPAEEGDVKSLDEAQTEEGGTTSPNEVQPAGCDATPLDELQTEESDVLTSRWRVVRRVARGPTLSMKNGGLSNQVLLTAWPRCAWPRSKRRRGRNGGEWNVLCARVARRRRRWSEQWQPWTTNAEYGAVDRPRQRGQNWRGANRSPRQGRATR
ncbi:hypothetical protein PR002_g22283 [Phytophthora rubi]|uniref:Uncharacterized protein n=1 Tax=Phytophthora rubi TaxID=129364 RepID=A0A6A3IX81_9STRA|nr:hypothetical protein PR002_g22283 [Phytophthora rubi]